MQLVEYFADAFDFDDFVARAENRGRSFARNYRDAVIPTDLVNPFREAVRLQGGLRVLVVSEAWCPDAAANIPPLVRFLEAVAEDLDVPLEVGHRFRDASRALWEALNARGVTRIPAVILADGDHGLIGVWEERPAAAQALVTRIKDLRARGEDSSKEASALREGYQSGRLVRSMVEELLDMMG